MGTPVPTVLVKDVWTLVLTNVIRKGKIFIIDKNENNPTEYLVTFVNTGDPAPDVNFEGGEIFDEAVIIDSDFAMDVYVKPVNHDGYVGVVV